MEDYPMHAIFSRYTKFAYLSEKCVVYRKIKNSISQTRNSERYLHYIRGYVAVRKYLNELFPDECKFDINELNDKLKYAELKIIYGKFKYDEAYNIHIQIKTQVFKNKRLVKYASNRFSFYLLGVMFYIKSLFQV
jgi:hypothetical protein